MIPSMTVTTARSGDRPRRCRRPTVESPRTWGPFAPTLALMDLGHDLRSAGREGEHQVTRHMQRADRRQVAKRQEERNWTV